AGAGDDTIREGLGQHRAGDCVLVAGQPAHRQADVLLLRERGVLLIAEALTGPADDRTAVRYGNPHLRDADCDGGAAGVILSSTEMMIYELLRSSGAPAFRELLPYLKG